MLNTEASVRFMPRAMEDLSNITAYWQRNITKEEAQKISAKILRDLKELALFYPSANEIRYEPLKSQAFRFYRSGAYIAICKKIENVIYIYHIAHEDEEYPEIFVRR
ncbi:MAG: hypothetical protein DBY32_11840 [Phascolarctobacterium sp.]|nr:MAG: hypothetical protein DBY32_11840 [Phascolarctobacterium sp.]